MRYYIYKLTFENGCTYIGEHIEKVPGDGYITSSSYFHKHKNLKYTRDIILECKSRDVLEVMETICIMADKRDNPKNVNYNLGAYHSPFGSHCLGGYFGESNPFYGKHHSEASREKMKLSKKKLKEAKENLIRNLPEGLSKKDLAKVLNRKVEGLYEVWKLYKETHKYYSQESKFLGSLPEGLTKQDFKAICEKESIKNIDNKWKSYNKGKKIKHYWFWNTITYEETYLPKKPGADWCKGRLPYKYWTEERKESYREKHGGPTRFSEEEKKKIWGGNHSTLGKVCYTNGQVNKFLYPGENVPEGFWRGSKQCKKKY